MNLASQAQKNLIVGAGVTGMSCLRYLEAQGVPVSLYEDVLSHEKRDMIKSISAKAEVFDKNNDFDVILDQVVTLVLSPGVSLKHPLVSEARKKSLEMIGDIELFARAYTQPVLAVTGSNAKSTVVTLLHLMALEDGKNAALAGNIGTPVLDVLQNENHDLYVLELSSFQLDTTYSLNTLVSCILNISPDHLDRYESYEAYAQSKQAIYQHAQYAVFNRDDLLTKPNPSFQAELISFGMDKPAKNDFGLLVENGESFLACGEEKILAVSHLAKKNFTDIQNALAALAIARVAGIRDEAIIKVLKTFKGLSHRCEVVAQKNDICWINDSKGTNVGASLAALQSFSNHPVILIAGGDSKGGDLTLLKGEVRAHVKYMLLMGKDAQLFYDEFRDDCKCEFVANLDEAVSRAASIAKAGDVVLLSPACSSLDMFSSYVERGNLFMEKVRAFLGGVQ